MLINSHIGVYKVLNSSTFKVFNFSNPIERAGVRATWNFSGLKAYQFDREKKVLYTGNGTHIFNTSISLTYSATEG
jgi:hypothetical protein